MAAVLKRAAEDARAIAAGGADAIIVENIGDAPFAAGQVDHFTVASLTRAAMAIREAAPDLPLGINVLRNDARAAMAIAVATDASFIRVNVLTGVMVTDQGVIQGEARDLLLDRNRLGADIKIAADVLVKHAVPLGSPNLRDVARDTFNRGGADALIVTGSGTGQPLDLKELERVHRVVPQAPIWAGSGMTPSLASGARQFVDAMIVGTWLHEKSDLELPVQAERVEALLEVLVE